MATEGLVNLFSTTVGPGGIAAGTVGASGTLPVVNPAPASMSGLQFAVIVNPGQSNQEIMEVTAGNQTTGWTVTRGSEGLGTSGAASAPQHFANEPIEAVITVQGLKNFITANSSSAPTGAASGDLTGAYPSPTIATGAVTSAKIADGTIVDADVSATAAIASSKIAGSLPPSGAAGGDLAGSTYPNPTLAAGSVNSSKIADGTLVDADISASAGIGIAKLFPNIDLRYARVGQLGPGSGTDDLATINAALAANSYVRGLPGAIYLVSGPLVVPSSTTLDMTGCTIRYSSTAVRKNLLNNAAVTPSNTVTDVTTTVGSAVITSPALIAAGAAVNHRVGVVGAGVTGGGSGPAGRIWLYGTIQSITGNNITLTSPNVTAAPAASVALTNATAYLYKTRDHDVTVIGGIWDAGTNWNVFNDRYNAGWQSNLLNFRRCDGLTVRDVQVAIDVGYKTSGLGWCFGICPADCTDILIEHCGSPNGQTAPTVVNTSGLNYYLTVRDIYGTSYDDHVAIGTVGAPFDDIEGDIAEVLIDGVMVNGSLRAVDLYCGQGTNGAQRYMTNVELRSIKGGILTGTGSAAAPIQITNYNGNAQIKVDLYDISTYKTGAGAFQVAVPAGQTGITVSGPNGGSDLNYASITANAPIGTASTPVDVLTITFVAPPTGQVWVEFGAYSIGQGTAAGNIIAYITDNANVVAMQQFLGNIGASGFSPGPSLKVKVFGLTPGTSYTYKARASTSAASAGNVLAGVSYPAFLRVWAAA